MSERLQFYAAGRKSVRVILEVRAHNIGKERIARLGRHSRRHASFKAVTRNGITLVIPALSARLQGLFATPNVNTVIAAPMPSLRDGL